MRKASMKFFLRAVYGALSSCLLQVSLMVNKLIEGRFAEASGPKIPATADTRAQRERFFSI